MSDLDLQFEEFLKEPLSTDDSPELSNPKPERSVKPASPEPHRFWWMKQKSPPEPPSHSASPGSARSGAGKKRGSASPEVTSSMAEFLEKEKFCRIDDDLGSVSEIDSPGMDLDDVTDDDIGSIMEQLSQLAGSGDDSVADKSVEEILKEAEDLVRETSHSFSALKTPLTPEIVLRGQPDKFIPTGFSTSDVAKRREDVLDVGESATTPLDDMRSQSVLPRTDLEGRGRSKEKTVTFQEDKLIAPPTSLRLSQTTQEDVSSASQGSTEAAASCLLVKPLPVVPEESSLSDTSSEIRGARELSDKSVQADDDRTRRLEQELAEERKRTAQFSEMEEGHKKQVDAIKCRYEEQMFELKKHIVILNAKIADLEKQQTVTRTDAIHEQRVALLEAELRQQEQLMQGYQRENMKLCQDMKQLKEEMKVKEMGFAEERKQLAAAKQDQEVERLRERLKDKEEGILKLQLEAQALKDKCGKLEVNADKLETCNRTLRSELEQQRRANNRVATTPVKTAVCTQELERCKEELARREREVDEIRRELHLTQSQLVSGRAEVSDCQLRVGELETKLSELQGSLRKERAENIAHVHRTEEDKKKIQDLNRQVKEMERILKRHHPNSISALILTANSEGADAPTPRVKFLENRVQQLEQELARSESEAQAKVADIQSQFQQMKVKYEEHTGELELQLATVKHQANMWRQAAEDQPMKEAKQAKKCMPPPMVITVGAPHANALAVREDAHLLATIRGLKQELVAKDRELVKIRRELDEAGKTNRRLQKERERQLGIVAAPPRPPAVRGPARDEQSSESSPRSVVKVFEPAAEQQQEILVQLEQENGKLRHELVRLEEEYRNLHDKRLQDLNLLQEEHEAEIEHLMKDHVTRNVGSSRIGEQLLIEQLRQQLKRMEGAQEELELLRVERVHLEKSNLELHKKLADMRTIMTPEMLQFEALQEKLADLERRHEVREQKLQAMVRDLLRRNAEYRSEDGVREKLIDKNRQLCLYRAEIDRILDALREFNRSKKSA